MHRSFQGWPKRPHHQAGQKAADPAGLIIAHFPKTKPGTKARAGRNQRSTPRGDNLTLAELESTTGALAAVLLGFLDARVAGQEAIAA